MTTIDLMHWINYKYNQPTSRLVKFGHLTIRVPRGVCVSHPNDDDWVISLKNLKAKFSDIRWVTQVTAKSSRPYTLENAYKDIMLALAMSSMYCNADHGTAINTGFKIGVQSYQIYRQYNLPPIRGICLNLVGTTRIRVRTKIRYTRPHGFSHGCGLVQYDKVTYVKIDKHLTDSLIEAIKEHIRDKGSLWIDQNADAKEFLKNF